MSEEASLKYLRDEIATLEEENKRLRATIEAILFGANLAGNGLLSAEGVKLACKSALEGT